MMTLFFWIILLFCIIMQNISSSCHNGFRLKNLASDCICFSGYYGKDCSIEKTARLECIGLPSVCGNFLVPSGQKRVYSVEVDEEQVIDAAMDFSFAAVLLKVIDVNNETFWRIRVYGSENVEVMDLSFQPAALAVGDAHLLVLDIAGKAYSAFENRHGQLGDGTTTFRHNLVSVRDDFIDSNEKIIRISSHYDMSVFLSDEGKILVCGLNSYGSLGRNSQLPYISIPSPVGFGKDISAGLYSSWFVDTSGDIWAAGNNPEGILSTGSTQSFVDPHEKVTGLSTSAKGIYSSFYCQIILTEENEVFSFGANNYFQIGGIPNPVLSPRPFPGVLVGRKVDDAIRGIDIGVYHFLAISQDDIVLSGCFPEAYASSSSVTVKCFTLSTDNVVSIEPEHKPVKVIAGGLRSLLLSYEFSCSEPDLCSNNGECIDQDICRCDVGWLGSDCSILSCFGIPIHNSTVCSGNGECDSPNMCSCFEGFEGKECDFPICHGESKDEACSAHGVCVEPDSCECQPNYAGERCEQWNCYGESTDTEDVCSGHGYCVAIDQCDCIDGYSGNQCDVVSCYGILFNDSKACSSHGICVSPDECQCDEDYGGVECELVSCGGFLENSCSGHGSCISPNNCSCIEGYGGDSCEIFQCGEYLSSDSMGCSGHGDCVALNQCNCSNNYYGESCSEFCLPDLNCSSNGFCNKNGTCDCNDRLGFDCSISISEFFMNSHGSRLEATVTGDLIVLECLQFFDPNVVGTGAQCGVSDNILWISMDETATIVPMETITLNLGGKSIERTVIGPDSFLQPKVILTKEGVYGDCGPVKLDARGSESGTMSSLSFEWYVLGYPPPEALVGFLAFQSTAYVEFSVELLPKNKVISIGLTIKDRFGNNDTTKIDLSRSTTTFSTFPTSGFTIRRSDHLYVNLDIDSGCFNNSNVEVSWKFLTGNHYPDISQFRGPELVINPYELGVFYHYKLLVTLTNVPDSPSKEISFSVDRTNVVAFIKGGFYQTAYVDSDIQFDGRESFDPDLPESNSHMTFVWSIQSTNGISYNHVIQCIRCPVSTIPSSSLLPDTEYRVSLTVRASARPEQPFQKKSSTIIRLHLQKDVSYGLTIHSSFQLNNFPSHQTLTLKGYLSNAVPLSLDTLSSKRRFNESGDTFIPRSESKATFHWNSPQLDIKQFLVDPNGMSKPILRLKENALLPDSIYEFSLTVKLGKFDLRSSVFVHVATKMEFDPIVNIDPPFGEAMKTRFKIKIRKTPFRGDTLRIGIIDGPVISHKPGFNNEIYLPSYSNQQIELYVQAISSKGEISKKKTAVVNVTNSLGMKDIESLVDRHFECGIDDGFLLAVMETIAQNRSLEEDPLVSIVYEKIGSKFCSNFIPDDEKFFPQMLSLIERIVDKNVNSNSWKTFVSAIVSSKESRIVPNAVRQLSRLLDISSWEDLSTYHLAIQKSIRFMTYLDDFVEKSSETTYFLKSLHNADLRLLFSHGQDKDHSFSFFIPQIQNFKTLTLVTIELRNDLFSSSQNPQGPIYDILLYKDGIQQKNFDHSPVVMELPHTDPNLLEKEMLTCKYYNSTHFDAQGCEMVRYNANTVTCSCLHLSIFSSFVTGKNFNCYGISYHADNVCSSAGSCVLPNQCLCNSGYSGNNCSDFSCGEYHFADTRVCGNRGTCASPDNCICEQGSGLNCTSIPEVWFFILMGITAICLFGLFCLVLCCICGTFWNFLRTKRKRSKKLKINPNNKAVELQDYAITPIQEMDPEFQKPFDPFICPLTNEMMEDPVSLSDTGMIYERNAIEKWLSQSSCDPITKQPLRDKTLHPCDGLRLEILATQLRNSAESCQPIMYNQELINFQG